MLLLGLWLSAGEFVTVAAAQGLLLVVGAAAASTIPWLVSQQLLRGDTPAHRAAAARSSVAVASVAAVLAGVGTALLATFATPGERLALAVSAALLCLGQVAVGWAQGSGRLRLLAGLVVGEVVVKVAAGAGAVLAGAGALGAIWSTAAGALLLVLVGSVLLRGARGPAASGVGAGSGAGSGLWRDAAGIGALRSVVAAVMVTDVVLVAAFLVPTRAVADYQLAMAIGRVPVFLATAVAQAYLVVLIRRPSDRLPREETWRRLLTLAVPAAAAIATVPPTVAAVVLPGGPTLSALLPLAAVTGLAMGVLQLVTTWGQAVGRWRSLVGGLCALWALHATVVLVGASTGDVRAVAAATAVGSCLVVAGCLALVSRGVGLSPRPPAWALVSTVVLLAASAVPVLWLAAVVVVGSLTLHQLVRPGPAPATVAP